MLVTSGSLRIVGHIAGVGDRIKKVNLGTKERKGGTKAVGVAVT
jgi:hypothetical protein